jgi:hypothetical protein|tara:strand:+ start:8512 stop:8649 length:138 start_codon:yes stop_codon:yes gene_type:complete
MSKNSSKQVYNQLLEWLKTRGIDPIKASKKRPNFNNNNNKRSIVR